MCLWRAQVHPPERAARRAMAAGIACFALGDVYWSMALSPLADPPFPSAADFSYLGFPVGVYVGALILLRRRFDPIPGSMWLDGMVAGIAVAAIVAALLPDPVLDVSGAAASTTSTASMPTTTGSATGRATTCSPASEPGWWRPWKAPAWRTGSAATSSAS